MQAKSKGTQHLLEEGGQGLEEEGSEVRAVALGKGLGAAGHAACETDFGQQLHGRPASGGTARQVQHLLRRPRDLKYTEIEE